MERKTKIDAEAGKQELVISREFERLTDDSSILKMHIVYRSVALRDQMLQLPFVQGLNMAHNRLQDIVKKLK